MAVAAACALGAAPAAAAERAVVAFLDSRDGPRALPPYEHIAARPDLALGLMSATQGSYSVRQTLLDMTQGNRTSRGTYTPDRLPRMVLVHDERGWRIKNWDVILTRAKTAYADIRPGLLASSVGGAAFVASEPAAEAVLAADRTGRVADVAYGGRRTYIRRVREAIERRRLVVTVLPGVRALDQLRALRGSDELLVVIRRPPRVRAPQLLAVGIAGLAEEPSMLRSATARRDGFVAGIDLLPTLVGTEDVDGVTGRTIAAVPGRDPVALRRMERRLRVVYPRRFPALNAMLLALMLAGVGLGLAGRRRQAARVCALAVLWVPFVALAGAALAPSWTGELALMGAGTVLLALLTDHFVRWPRGPAVPALFGVGGYCIDLAGNSYLTIRSLLGPNPRFGSRFYGVGNELEATLPVLALVGLAALLWRVPPGRRLAAIFAAAMIALGGVLGAGRLGADVGGVISVGAATAAAVLVAWGQPPRWAIALALLAPALALAALAALDLATGGDSHFARLLGGDGGDLADTVQRRYKLAWQALRRGLMPLATVAAILLPVLAWQRRERWYGAVRGSRAWAAALLGGLAGAVLGMLTNDSGPVLLVLGVVVLGAATVYLRGAPADGAAPAGPADSSETSPAPTRSL